MTVTSRTALILTLAVGVALGMALKTGAEAVPSKPKVGGKAHKLYAQGMKLAEQEKWSEAHAVFTRAHEVEKTDPDVLNMLAFTTRKHSKDYRKAMTLYYAALERRPAFPQAREYLAEAYLQAALKELQILQSYGKRGEAQAKKVADAFAAAAKTVKGGVSGEKKRDW